MTDEQKLKFLLTELKLAARQKNCYDENGANGIYYDYPEDSLQAFEDGQVYGWSSFARGLLEGMDENYG